MAVVDFVLLFSLLGWLLFGFRVRTRNQRHFCCATCSLRPRNNGVLGFCDHFTCENYKTPEAQFRRVALALYVGHLVRSVRPARHFGRLTNLSVEVTEGTIQARQVSGTQLRASVTSGVRPALYFVKCIIPGIRDLCRVSPY
jgi:hypothetical protein